MLQPMMGPAKNASASRPASARSLQPDLHDPLKRDIMSVVKVPSRRRLVRFMPHYKHEARSRQRLNAD